MSHEIRRAHAERVAKYNKVDFEAAAAAIGSSERTVLEAYGKAPFGTSPKPAQKPQHRAARTVRPALAELLQQYFERRRPLPQRKDVGSTKP